MGAQNSITMATLFALTQANENDEQAVKETTDSSTMWIIACVVWAVACIAYFLYSRAKKSDVEVEQIVLEEIITKNDQNIDDDDLNPEQVLCKKLDGNMAILRKDMQGLLTEEGFFEVYKIIEEHCFAEFKQKKQEFMLKRINCYKE